MTPRILAIRISRRALAGAALHGDALNWAEGHHLTSRHDRVLAAAERYVVRTLDQTDPSIVFLYAPTTGSGTTVALSNRVESLLNARHIPLERVTTAELLMAYGHPPLRHTGELQSIVQVVWASLQALTTRTKPYVVSAAAVALYGATRTDLRGVA
jgi:hypothetical protein